MTGNENIDLGALAAEELARLVGEYGLRLISLDSYEVFLMGPGYVLDFAADREGVELSYIECGDKGQLTAYTMRPLIMKRFRPEDRENFGSPITLRDRWAAALRVYAAGLRNRCQDVLKGERGWINRSEWRIENPSAKLQEAIKKHVQSST
jgi:hypothetical protein